MLVLALALFAQLQASPLPSAPAAPPTPPPLTAPSAPPSAGPNGPTPAPITTPTPTTPPGSMPPPTPGASPSPSASPTPAPNPYQFVLNPSPAPSGQPQIVQIAINNNVQHEGGDLLLRVVTSADVSQMQLRCMGRMIGVQQAAPGLFTGEQRLPTGIPFFFMNRWYNVDFIASTQDGKSTTVTVPVRLEH